MKTRSTLIASLLALCTAAPALAADPIVFTSWGGTTQSSQQKNWAQPFTQATGINVLMDGPTDYGKLKAMVDSGNVNWDVVDVEGDFAYAAQQAGLIEPIDYSVVKKDELDPRFATPAAVGSFYYSFVLGYNKAKYAGAQPQSWADLFDTRKFPGKRTLYKWSAPGVLEIALLADGVQPNKLYPLDLDRAFKKLDTIKGDIVWWSGGAQSQQLLASGEAPIGMFWNGRLHALEQTGVPVGISWNQNLTAADMLVIPKTHAASLEDVDEPLGAHVFHVAHHLARALRRSPLQCDGINIFLADGAAAFQSVFHLHLHVFPRTVHDGFRLDVAWQARDRSMLDEDAEQVRAGLRALPQPYVRPCEGCPDPG